MLGTGGYLLFTGLGHRVVAGQPAAQPPGQRAGEEDERAACVWLREQSQRTNRLAAGWTDGCSLSGNDVERHERIGDVVGSIEHLMEVVEGEGDVSARGCWRKSEAADERRRARGGAEGVEIGTSLGKYVSTGI
jgi:hypothetical protein